MDKLFRVPGPGPQADSIQVFTSRPIQTLRLSQPNLTLVVLAFTGRDPELGLQGTTLGLELGETSLGVRVGLGSETVTDETGPFVILLDGEGPVHHGVCSSWLNRIQADDVVPCFVRG